jgi:hypothetical protein
MGCVGIRHRGFDAVRSRLGQTGAIALAVAASACGSGTDMTYSARDVQAAFSTVGLRSHVVFDPHTSTSPTHPRSSLSVEGPMFKMLTQASGDDHLVAVVAGPQRTPHADGVYEVVVKVFDRERAATQIMAGEGVAVACFGLLTGRRGNVVVTAPKRDFRRVRAALSNLKPKLSVDSQLPVLNTKFHCATG